MPSSSKLPNLSAPLASRLPATSRSMQPSGEASSSERPASFSKLSLATVKQLPLDTRGFASGVVTKGPKESSNEIEQSNSANLKSHENQLMDLRYTAGVFGMQDSLKSPVSVSEKSDDSMGVYMENRKSRGKNHPPGTLLTPQLMRNRGGGGGEQHRSHSSSPAVGHQRGSAPDPNSTSWSSGFGEESASTSDSTDSVIYQPTQSSCDELDPPASDVTEAVKVKQCGGPVGGVTVTDHISSLRQNKMKQQTGGSGHSQLKQPVSNRTELKKIACPLPTAAGSSAVVAIENSKKKVTTFDGDVTTEENDTTRGGGGGIKPLNADTEEVDFFEIKPMPPILRSTRGAYLRNTTPMLSQMRRLRPLIDASKIQAS